MELVYDSRGLIPAVVQDNTSGEVLMMAWMNAESLELTQQSGEVHFWSRSREALWKKGETSGNILYLRELFVDCDADTILVKVDASGPACHTGSRTCFFRTFDQEQPNEVG
jgi:phosphoribosyl-AMP cyclohydrolase